MRTKLAEDIIAEQDRLALAILLNEYDDIREEWLQMLRTFPEKS